MPRRHPAWRITRNRSTTSYFPGTLNDFGPVKQFQTTLQCGGPFGPDSTYCATQIK